MLVPCVLEVLSVAVYDPPADMLCPSIIVAHEPYPLPVLIRLCTSTYIVVPVADNVKDELADPLEQEP